MARLDSFQTEMQAQLDRAVTLLLEIKGSVTSGQSNATLELMRDKITDLKYEISSFREEMRSMHNQILQNLTTGSD